MRRKLIQHSPTSLVMTLPADWLAKYELKKGDEVFVEEDNARLIVEHEKKNKLLEKRIDITGLDRTTIMFIIRNLYRIGYDEVNIKFKETKIKNRNNNKEILISSVIHQETNRLIGYEVVKEEENNLLIRNISEGLTEDLSIIRRRTHLLLANLAESIYLALSKKDHDSLELFEDKHELVLRFINYTLRQANKSAKSISHNQYHELATLDRIVYLLRSSARKGMELKDYSESIVQIASSTVKTLRVFHKLAHTKNSSLLAEMNKERYKTEEYIKKIKASEIQIGNNLKQIHNLLLDVSCVIGD